jgi:hypothetical protein
MYVCMYVCIYVYKVCTRVKYKLLLEIKNGKDKKILTKWYSDKKYSKTPSTTTLYIIHKGSQTVKRTDLSSGQMRINNRPFWLGGARTSPQSNHTTYIYMIHLHGTYIHTWSDTYIPNQMIDQALAWLSRHRWEGWLRSRRERAW